MSLQLLHASDEPHKPDCFVLRTAVILQSLATTGGLMQILVGLLELSQSLASDDASNYVMKYLNIYIFEC